MTDIVSVWLPQRGFDVDGGLMSRGIVLAEFFKWVWDTKRAYSTGLWAAEDYSVGYVQYGVGRTVKEDHQEDYKLATRDQGVRKGTEETDEDFPRAADARDTNVG